MVGFDLSEDFSREGVNLGINDDIHFRAIIATQERRAIKADGRRVCDRGTIAPRDDFPIIPQKQIDSFPDFLRPNDPRLGTVQLALSDIQCIRSAKHLPCQAHRDPRV